MSWDSVIRTSRRTLTVKETIDLIEKAQTGDTLAETELVLANLPLVVWQARKLSKGFRSDLDDLVSEGLLGMIEAVRRFNTKRGVKFTTFAVFYIRKAMLAWIPDRRPGISIKKNLYYVTSKILKAFDDHGDHLTDEELSSMIGYGVLVIARARKAVAILKLTRSSIQKPFEPSYTVDTFGKAVNEETQREVIRLLDESLDARTTTIIRMRFGIGYNEPMKLSDIAINMRVSKQAIQQTINKALDLIRYKLSGRDHA